MVTQHPPLLSPLATTILFPVSMNLTNIPWVRSLGWEDPLEQGYGNPFHYCLENPMDGEAWPATVHGVAKSQAQLKRLSIHAHTFQLYYIYDR